MHFWWMYTTGYKCTVYICIICTGDIGVAMKKKVEIITEAHQDINTANDPDMIGTVVRVTMTVAHHMNMLTANMKAKMKGHRGL